MQSCTLSYRLKPVNEETEAKAHIEKIQKDNPGISFESGGSFGIDFRPGPVIHYPKEPTHSTFIIHSDRHTKEELVTLFQGDRFLVS